MNVIEGDLIADNRVELNMGPGQTNWPFVINVGNSIIGVTVLAMPFCFKTCGIVLGSLLLFFSTWLTLKSCKLLMKAGVTSRRRSYSLLAHYTHGATGKLIVEIGMIGLQLGTLVAQVVIIGDLGPAIVSKFTGLQNTDRLRTGLIVFLCLFVGLPLGLLKDVRTLSKTSAMCIMFYAFFTVYVVLLSVPKLATSKWYTKVNFWRKEGFFQCLPIFSFAFGCQTQLFIVYEALSEPSLKRINSIVSSAVHMCTAAYLLVGFFGYIAFCDVSDLSGDIINHFSEDTVSDAIKLCFVCSIAVSIPLIVFPCRASLYTLLFPQKQKEDMPGSWKIPEFHFKVITAFIIIGSMIIGILVPNVEFVLGLNGATMGTLICYIFPAIFFLTVMTDTSEGKASGRMVLAFGLTILILSTYTTLATVKPSEHQVNAPVGLDKDLQKLDVKGVPAVDPAKQNPSLEDPKKDDEMKKPPDEKEERQEPANPQPPVDQDIKPVPDKKDTDQDKKNKELKDADVKEIAQNKETGDEKEKKVKEEEEKVKAEIEEKARQEVEQKWKEKDRKQEEILEKLEQQKEEQQKIIEEQKHILEELKQHQVQHQDDDSLKVQVPAVQEDEVQPGHQQPIAVQQQNQGVAGQQGVQQQAGQQQIVQQAGKGEQAAVQGNPLPQVDIQRNQLPAGQAVEQDRQVLVDKQIVNKQGGMGQPVDQLQGLQQKQVVNNPAGAVIQPQEQQQQPGDLGNQQNNAGLKEMAQGAGANENNVFDQILGNPNNEVNQGDVQNNVKPVVKDDETGEKQADDLKKRMKRDVDMEEEVVGKKIEQDEHGNNVGKEEKVEKGVAIDNAEEKKDEHVIDNVEEKKVELVADAGAVQRNENDVDKVNGGNRDLKQVDSPVTEVGSLHDSAVDGKAVQDIDVHINELSNKINDELQERISVLDINKNLEKKR